MSGQVSKNVLKAASPVVAARVINIGFSLARGPIVAHYLAPEAYGKLGMVVATTAFVKGLLSSRVWETVIKYTAEFRNAGDHASAGALIGVCFALDVAAGVVAFLICLGIAAWGAEAVMGDASLATPLRVYALTILVLMTEGTQAGLLRFYNRFTALSVVSVIGAALRLASAIGVVRYDLGMLGLIWTEVLAGVVSTIGGLWLVREVLMQQGTAWPALLRWRILRGRVRELSLFLLSTNLTATIRLGTTSLDTLILGHVAGATAVGHYRLCRMLVEQCQMVVDSLRQVVYPMIVKSFKTDQAKPQYWSALFRGSRQLALWLGLSCVFVIVFAEPIIAVFGGRQFLGAADMVRIMFLSIAIWGPLLWVPPLFMAADRSFWNTVAAIVQGVVLLGGVALTARWYGAFGASIAYTASLVAWALYVVPCMLTLRRRATRLPVA